MGASNLDKFWAKCVMSSRGRGEEQRGEGKVEVSQIRVVDTNSNYVDYATPSDFWFETDGDLADAKVAEFNFPLKAVSSY